MKHNYLIAILLMAFLTSCSSDNDSTSENTTETDYFPVENGGFWVYDVSGEFPGRDSLYVANDTMINTTSYQKFKTKEMAFGFYSGSLAGNGVRKSGDKILVSGSTGVDLIEGFPIDLEVTDFVIFKESASDNEQLSSTSGTFTYTFEEIPLTFNYTMKSVFQETLASYTVPNYGTYDNVKVVKIIVNLQVGGVAGPFPINVMEPQDVVVSTQYYVKNIGMVYSTTDISYELTSSDLPFPSSGSRNIKEYLADHNVTTPVN